MKNFKQSWQRSIDRLGEDWATVLRIMCYISSGLNGLSAVLAPASEFVVVGKFRFYELWQKLCFSAGAASLSFGMYKLGNSYRTTSQRSRF